MPLIVRWPGVIKPGTIYNDIISQEDWMPTLLAAAGEPDVVEKLEARATQANGKTFKVHPDGYNFLPYFKGEATKGPREEILYFGQGGELNAVRWNDWKVNFAGIDGNIATGVRAGDGLAAHREPARRPVREDAVRVRPVHPLVRGQHLALRAGAGSRSRRSSRPSRSIPFQQGSSLNAAGINYQTLKAADAMKRLKEIETLGRPGN